MKSAGVQHMRAVPARITEVGDSEWLAELLRHGLPRASFIPPSPSRALRELTRYRKTLVQQRADHVNRVQKTLEGTNLKLAAVATDILAHADFLEQAIAQVQIEIERCLPTYADVSALLNANTQAAT